MSRSAQEGSSSHAEPVALHLDDVGMRHGRRNRLCRSLDQRLEFAIGAHGKPLDDRRRQDALAIAEVSDIVTKLSLISTVFDSPAN
jgi:hypothetical protein